MYGHSARIYHFDHLVSQAFSYTSSPHLLGYFLWQLIHPEKSIFGITGLDTTVTQLTKEEVERMLDIIQHYHLGLHIDVAKFMQYSHYLVASYSPLSNGYDPSFNHH